MGVAGCHVVDGLKAGAGSNDQSTKLVHCTGYFTTCEKEDSTDDHGSTFSMSEDQLPSSFGR